MKKVKDGREAPCEHGVASEVQDSHISMALQSDYLGELLLGLTESYGVVVLHRDIQRR